MTAVEDNSPEKDNNTGILYAKKVYSNLCISKKFSRINVKHSIKLYHHTDSRYS